ncbi:MAG: hypothetical protein Q7U04_03175 [Bacteriovorax sp.]|nr:hypothetical protein [Bacteriovorax sp.]
MAYIKNSLIALFVLAIAALTSITATASILIEPHLGYNISGSGTTSGVDYKYSNPELGLRLGGQFLGFMAGVDYTSSSYTWTQSPGGDDKFDRGEFGLFVGYNLPILLRFWGAYYFSNTATDQSSSGKTASGAKFEGTTKELGVGFTALPFLSLNIMYRNVVLDTKPSNVTGADISNNEYVIGVSLPFTLL